jgi:hypothetical protein
MSKVGGGRIRYHCQRTFPRGKGGSDDPSSYRYQHERILRRGRREDLIPSPEDISQSDTATRGHSKGGRREDHISTPEDIPQARGGRIRYHQQRTFHR